MCKEGMGGISGFRYAFIFPLLSSSSSSTPFLCLCLAPPLSQISSKSRSISHSEWIPPDLVTPPLSVCPALFSSSSSSSQHTSINNTHPITVKSLLDEATPRSVRIGCCLALTSCQLTDDWLKLMSDVGIGGAPRGGVLCFCGSVAVALRKICVHAVIPTVTHSSLHLMALHWDQKSLPKSYLIPVTKPLHEHLFCSHERF